MQTKAFGLLLFFFLYCIPLGFIVFCYYFIVRTIFEHEKTLREQAKKMNVSSLRTNADANATSAEIKIAKVALCNIALWAGMWTPYAAIVLQVTHPIIPRDWNELTQSFQRVFWVINLQSLRW